jgi:hypothetical protein
MAVLQNNNGNVAVNDLVDNIRLALVNNQDIVPIIGFEMLPVFDNGIETPYLDYLAKKIATDKQLLVDPSLSGFDLFNDIAHKLLVSNQFNKLATTKQISGYAKNIHGSVNKSYLEKIVSIFPFKYFLNLTFTTHLAEVVEISRTFPKIAVNKSSFPFQLKNPKKPDDLKKNECGFVATIYNLFGISYENNNERFDYYYSDDDMLSFISEFNKRFEVDLKNYKEVIKESALLFLGCQYPDWLLRVLINTLSPGSLDSFNNIQTRVFVDYCNDNATIFFLDKHRLQFQRHLQTRPFVNDLFDVLSQNRFALDISRQGDFVFISYSREDLAIVQKIVCQLALYMNIWFDRVKLFPGNLINNDIKTAIDNCKLFLPIVTVRSKDKDGLDYIKQEWKYYHEKFANAGKVIPLIDKNLNIGGALGFNSDEHFANPRDNIFYIVFDETGLSEQDITNVKNRL